MKLSVREIERKDVGLLSGYWLDSDPRFLESLGVDLEKLPNAADLRRMLEDQLDKPYSEKPAYCIIWLVDSVPAGHSNINRIAFGEEASMHLHLWHDKHRRKGYGSRLLRMSLPFYFNNFALQRLICEPYALNPAPVKTLERAGFVFEKEYTTIPGAINFMQPVSRWILTYEAFEQFRLDDGAAAKPGG